MDVRREAEKATNTGITFWVKKEVFGQPIYFQFHHFLRPNLASGCVLLDSGLKRQLLGFLELDRHPQEATVEGVDGLAQAGLGFRVQNRRFP